jgi:hypothetical protein
MNRKKARALYTALFLCMAATGLTACGSDTSSESSDSEVVGRVTSISDSELQMEVFDMDANASEDKGDKFPGASGGAISGAAVKDGGDRPQMPEGTMPADGDRKDNNGENGKPDGTPPADQGNQGEAPDAKDGDADTKKDADGNDKSGSGQPSGESKTYAISSDTKVYQQDGDEKTEITLDELNPGSMVSVETDGDEVESITIQNSGFGGDKQTKS